VIVPHQALVYLPFAALRDGTSRRYLVEDYSLLHLPSAAALPLLRRSDRSVVDADAAPPQVFAPFPDALPATVAEAAAFGRSLPGARIHSGARATEGRVRQALASPGVVHVASHARLNVTNPLFSTIELDPGSAGSAGDDGRLHVHELLGLQIASDLVFLSGCETGLGGAWSNAFARGDDYATLSQALLYAGAQNVVATLWPVEDAGAAAFAERFYRALPDRPPPEALAEAQRRLIEDPKFGAPYYWAGYDVGGAGELRAVDPSRAASGNGRSPAVTQQPMGRLS
jgi:CHAT domain-containing protein